MTAGPPSDSKSETGAGRVKSPRNPVLGGETGVRLVRFTLFWKRAFETFAAAADGIAG